MTISNFTAIGAMAAAALSYHFNHDVLWAIGHGLLGWIYVLYRLFEYWL